MDSDDRGSGPIDDFSNGNLTIDAYSQSIDTYSRLCTLIGRIQKFSVTGMMDKNYFSAAMKLFWKFKWGHEIISKF